MITAAIMTVFYLFIAGMFSPVFSMPDVALPTGFTDAISTASGLISSIATFVPTTAILLAFTSALVVEGAVLIYRGVMWLITKIPGISN